MKHARLFIFTLALIAGGTLFGTQSHAHDNDRSWENGGPDYTHHSRYDHERHDYDRNDYDRNDYDRRDYHSRYDRHKDYWRINLSSREKERIGWKLEDAYEKRCSTVASRRYYGCLPPGRSYEHRVGNRLSPHVVTWAVPYNVKSMLPSPRYGTRYVWADRDILLVSNDTGVVLDVVRLIWG